jgi:hypothetical protein
VCALGVINLNTWKLLEEHISINKISFSFCHNAMDLQGKIQIGANFVDRQMKQSHLAGKMSFMNASWQVVIIIM